MHPSDTGQEVIMIEQVKMNQKGYMLNNKNVTIKLINDNSKANQLNPFMICTLF